jgi:hypothetical protein
MRPVLVELLGQPVVVGGHVTFLRRGGSRG